LGVYLYSVHAGMLMSDLGLRCTNLARIRLASGRDRNDISPTETATTARTAVVTPRYDSLCPTFRMTCGGRISKICSARKVLYFCILVVLCEYSKFRIESNSYLIFDSIRNWHNYSKFSYLTVISRVTEKWFVCTLPATGHCTRLSVEPSAVPHVFLPLPFPWPRMAPVRGRQLPCVRTAWVHASSARPWYLIAL